MKAKKYNFRDEIDFNMTKTYDLTNAKEYKNKD
jgi:hypothetical protein